MTDNVKVIGIDLAKNVFQLSGTNKHGKKLFSHRMNQTQMLNFLRNTPNCLIGIEACIGSHHWARTFRDMGHEVKMMAPQFVKPYVMSFKNDSNDADGISEAVTRPNMKFVPIKTLAQQDVLLLHRARQLSIKNRTAQGNQIRGLLADYGVVIPQGISVMRRLLAILEEHSECMSLDAKAIFQRLHEQFMAYDKQVDEYDKDIERHVANSPECKLLLEMDGIGPLTASALVASIGDGKTFKNGREVAAWLGLVPWQNSSGNKIRLGGISKRGDTYLRTLLIHGARSALNYVDGKQDRKSRWAYEKKQKMPFNKAAVALANKHARIVWAILSSGESYRRNAIGETA